MARPRLIETPNDLWELYQEYKKDTKDNPRYRTQFVGKDGNQVKEPLERPLTLEGFRVYCFTRIGCVKQYFDNPENRYDEFITICRAIREEIRQDQIEGGMVGQYNPSITQRLNGLREQTENINIEQPLFPDK